jgi:MFS family permease
MITSGYIGSIVSSLEIYYGFSTERLGIAFSSYDIIAVFIIPLISYFGSKYNRPRIVAFGAFLFAIGNILFILPYFLNGYHQIINNNSSNETSDYLCSFNSSNRSDDLCLSSSSSSSNSILTHFIPNILNDILISQPSWTYYILILSMITMSIGASPFYTLGITFLTDHLSKDDQAIYTSIYHFIYFRDNIAFFLVKI